MPRIETLITCEHAGNEIPPEYARLFQSVETVLESHRGFDPGTEELGRRFASELDAELVVCRVSRLLVEANRSLHHARLFSEFTRNLTRTEKQRIVERYYLPHRRRIEQAVKDRMRPEGLLLHIAVHSFTPVLDDQVRTADVSFLYDPGRPQERRAAAGWKKQILHLDPTLRVRFNYPYLGTADGLTTHLRRLHPGSGYAGLEIEVNQNYPLGAIREWNLLQEILTRSLQHLLQELSNNL